jgi:carboxyl-terminal processing protease
VGEKTYGKGSVQDLIDFDDKSSLKLTIALWLTPKGRSIDKEGILPDVAVERTAEDYQKDRDPQLDKALELLRTKP